MKRELKNKKFIPNNYLKSKNTIKNKGDKRGVIMLFILNIIMFPFIFSKTPKENKEIKNTNTLWEANNRQEEFKLWLNMSKYGGVQEFSLNTGEITLDTEENISNINKEKGIKVKELNVTSEGKYKIFINKEGNNEG